METKQIIKDSIAEAKKRIQEKILIDNLLIFVSRVIEDVSNDPKAKLFGRAKDLYLSVNPYGNYDGNQIIKFFQTEFNCKEGLLLTDEEKHLIKIIFNEMDNEFILRNGKIMKGRLKGILKKLCEKYLPNSSKIIEPLILCRIIGAVGGIDRIKNMPSSTIQLIGAEEALFRHLSKGNKSPKYGLIYYSKYTQAEKNKGKKARQIANKLAISIKIDYFQNLAR